MSTFDSEEQPAILQLRRWCQFRPKLSNIQQVFISPSRRILVLLSYQYEALLISLEKDTVDDGFWGTRTDKFSHQDSSYSCLVDSDESVGWSSFPEGSKLSDGFPLCSNSHFEQFAFISDVKSLAWVHCEDTYLHEDSIFREVLVVSSDHGITVHAFTHLDTVTQGIDSLLETETFHGKWVEWGPHHYEQTNNNFNSGLEEGDHCGTCEATSNKTDQHVPRGVSSRKSNWLRTFRVEVEPSESEDNFVVSFPVRSSFPRSAKIVSFSIFDRILNIIESRVYKESHECGSISETPGFMAVHEDPVSYVLPKGSAAGSKSPTGRVLDCCTCKQYRCTRVFSSPSIHSIGLVLAHDVGSPGSASSKVVIYPDMLLIILAVSHSGLQWVCAMDFQEYCPRTSNVLEWVDFLFLQSYVICLNISGLVYICDAKTGSLILWVDVLHNCDASLKVDSELDQRMYPLDRNSSTVMENSAGEFQTNDFNKEGSHSESHCSRKRIFRRLLITPFSQVLAAIDEHGVMYLISLDECRLGTIGSCKFCPSFGDFGLGMFACQKVAEIEISRQETFSECLSDLYLSSTDFDGNFVNTNSNGRNKKRHYFQFKQGQMSSNISSTYSHNGSCNICHCKLPSAYTRRIFLPTNKFNVDDEVCFSPFGVVRLFRSRSKSCIVHSCLHVGSSDFHERDMNKGSSFSKEFILDFEAIGCCFQGFLYLVTKEGLAVVLPSSSLSCNVMERESISCWQSCMTEVCQTETTGRRILCRDILRPWQLEVLDKTLLYEGAGEAEELCTVNGWDIKIARIRRLELALYYMKVDEIERSLEMLADANLAEEGVLKLLLTSAYKIFCRAGSENEVATASRLLALSACFATKMVRRYGLLEVQKDLPAFGCNKNMNISMHLTNAEANNSRKLEEMACYLEVMRNMQQKLSLKRKKPTHGMVDYAEVLMPLEAHALKDESLILDSVSSAVTESSEVEHVDERTLPCSDGIIDSADRLALASVEHSIDICETDLSIVTIGDQKRILIPRENSRDMMTRWKVDNFDLKTVVKDALHSGRLPLAVLQLHLHHLKDLVTEEEPYDSFGEVRDVGRAIAYDLFLKGETGLAMTTLQRLGEDMEASLRQLLLGTVQKIIRTQVADEMKKLGYLKAREWLTLEKLSLVERLYPSSSFWRTYVERRKLSGQVISSSFQPDNTRLKLNLHMWISHSIDCDEIDGVVNGSWTSISIPSNFASIDEDTARAGYWACAAIWSDSWDLTTIDRIVLDQPLTLGIHVPWESKFTYHMVHNDWDEVQKLLDMIPSTTLSEGILRINLGSLHPDAYADGSEGTCYPPYIVSADYLGPTFIYIPNVKILKSSVIKMCSSWLKTLLEQELAKRVIFLKEYWESTTEIILLLASAGFISGMHGEYTQAKLNINSVDLQFLNMSGKFPKDTVEALHRLVIHHCAKHNLPNLMDLYLDHHKLALDSDSVCSLKEAAEGCHWAKWLLLSRAKGHEYDASFSNAGSIISSHKIPNSSLNHVDFDEIIHTVDDIAEGCGEIAALTTLMYAPLPIQKCLHYGSVSRHPSSSYQCTLENLRPGLQKFPTLWRALLTASLGYDADTRFLSTNYYNVLGKSSLSDYLNWRGNIFLSSGGDTSLVQMLPGWFPKSIRRLIKLFVEGPLGWEMLSGVLPDEEAFVLRENASVFNKNRNMTSIGISWEMAAQKRVEEELYSSLEVNKFSIEHHLHRGRALAAFNDLLSSRALKCKSTHAQRELSGGSEPSPSNIQSDVQMLLEPLTPDERSVISSVMPLAIMNFRESSLVSTCAFVLELFGLSASLLHINIAALRRISSYYKSLEDNPHDIHVVNKSSAFPAVPHESDLTTSLARALADNYLQFVNLDILEKKDIFVEDNNQQAKNLITVLQHLEIASLPSLNEGQTCGSWLKNGSGDGTKFRLQQKADSQNWTLVAAFCQMHHLPQSTKYLSLLAKDNDWVGFFIEGQQGGFPIDTVIQVADKEFSDPRLRMHILTVLRSMQSIRKNATSPTSLLSARKSSEISSMDLVSAGPVELFALAAECEGKKNPGQALLMKAKDLSWSLLAMIASCFPDVSPLSCLTVWLEISASRETSSLKVNDISSQITRNVRAAVEANNALPNSSRDVAFHYNRRNPKRRHKMEPSSGIHSTTFSNAVSSIIPTEVEASQMTASDRKRCAVADEQENIFCDPDELLLSLSDMVAMLCKQNSFLLLLRAFDLFLPLSSLVPFIRFLQAFSQMRLSEASAHLASFSARFKEDHYHLNFGVPRDGQISATWISSTAVKAADAVLTTCPSAYERRYLLKLLSDADFGDGGTAATWFQRQYWKINLAEPSLRADSDLCLGNEILDDLSLLTTLERNARWDQARSWAKQLESSSESLKSSFHHVTEMQAEALVAEWKEFLWDVPDERPAVWSHCQKLFVCHSFPPLQAGKFFLKHAEAIEKEIPARELHELLLLSLQWLSGMITQSNPVYPLHLLREIETRVWLLAVESETQTTLDLDPAFTPLKNVVGEDNPSIIDNTANIIAKMDNHINSMRMRINEKNGPRDSNKLYHQPIVPSDLVSQSTSGSNSRSKRRAKGSLHLRRTLTEHGEKNIETDETSGLLLSKNSGELSKQLLEENTKLETSFSGWEERVRPVDLERAVLSLLEFGQVTAAKQLQQKLSPTNVPSELEIIDTALKLAAFLSPSCNGEVPLCDLDSELSSVIESYEIQCNDVLDLLQVVESLAMKCGEGSGRGLCRRIVTIFRAARVLGLSFSEAFDKQPIEILQLLSLKAQESLDEARLLVQSHAMPPASIARILAESFLKGLLAAHRGGYMDSQKDEGPSPLLWRLSDFLKWAELCPSEQEIGHALMRLVMTGQEIPHACEVELLILAHHFYKSSACLDGVDVLVALAANRVESYVIEGDFSCLARLVTGVSNFYALNFILGILIENGQLELLLQKYSAADPATGTSEVARGFRMAVLTALKRFNSDDVDAFAMVYNHFDMKHDTASLLESRSKHSLQLWSSRHDKDRQNADLLDSMRYLIEAADVYTTIDAGQKTHRACARSSLLSLQIRIPEIPWMDLSDTNARRIFVEQSRFQEALIVAEAYGLNQPSEWALVLWNHMLRPDIVEQFVADFVAILPLQPSMLLDLARFYRSEVAARGDQSQFSVWLSTGGLPAEWGKHLGKSFRCLLKKTRDLRVRIQLATVATGFIDVIDMCNGALDKVPETAGPLILRKGHGGAYLPLM